MEEKNSQQKNMDATAIDNVKASLMGPLAGLGDSFFWGTLRLIATGIGTSGAEGQHPRADPVSAGI